MLGNYLGCRLFIGMTYINRKLQDAFNKELQMLKTRCGRRELHQSLQTNYFLDVVLAIFHDFISQEFTSRLHFHVDDDADIKEDY